MTEEILLEAALIPLVPLAALVWACCWYDDEDDEEE